MERIHDTKPVLKTMFRFGIPKPRSQLYTAFGPQDTLVKSEDMVLPVMVYSISIVGQVFSEENWPEYILRYTQSEDAFGYITLEEEFRGKWEEKPVFPGIKILCELDPMYDKATIINDFYARLKEHCSEYAKINSIEVDWDEEYAYVGSHSKGLMPIIIRNEPQLRR